MKIRSTMSMLILLAATSPCLARNGTDDSRHGSWLTALATPKDLDLFASDERSVKQRLHLTDAEVSELIAISDNMQFKITREAGSFNFVGWIDAKGGQGLFEYLPDSGFHQRMLALGFTDLDSRKQFQMAIAGVSLASAQELRGTHLRGLDSEKLIAFCVHGVSAAYIRDILTSGISVPDSAEVLALRIHEVSPELLRALSVSGQTFHVAQVIALRAQGGTAEWINDLRALGYGNVGVDDLIAFRIHQISPEFISGLQKLDYQRPTPQQLVAMSIYGVSPDYIASLRARGMVDLSVDQLVGMRIRSTD